MDFIAVQCNEIGGVINGQRSVDKHRVFIGLGVQILHPALGGPDSCHHFIHRERLGQIIIRASVKGFDLVAVLIPGTDNDDHGAAPGAHIADHLNPVDIRQSEIQKDQIGIQ